MNNPEIDSLNKTKFEDWLKELDTVVFATETEGTCTKYSVYDGISAEERNIPARW
jgi:hypothetical protein